MGAALRASICTLVLAIVSVVSSLIFIQTCHALTASYGRPYQGHLENGVVFPNQFPGYHLRDESRSYTTPEVVGALLDAIEAVRTQFPDTCDVFLGDFSAGNGGSAIHHRSHQNGRDVDVGLYAKGNHPLNTFVPMYDIVDAPKTWCLIENLIASQRVQYIFLDRRIQKVLYDYAVTRGYDQAYLDRVFGNVRGSLIQHVKNHFDHMHVRFFTPWSTLAAHIGSDEREKLAVVDVAQQSYLPKKVNYYVSGSEKGLDELAQSFGVTAKDLCRWNHVSQSGVPVPGSCLVFYKRSFESEPVLLARSLQPGYIAQQAPRVKMASLQTEPEPVVSVSDSTSSEDAEPVVEESSSSSISFSSGHQKSGSAPAAYYTVKSGGTLQDVSKKTGIALSSLCQLNGLNRNSHLKAGQKIKLAQDDLKVAANTHKRGSTSSSICFASDSKKPGSPTAAYYTVNSGGTLMDVSKKTGIPLSSLCQLNGLGRNANLKPGQKVKLTQANLPLRPSLGKASCSVKDFAKKPAAVKPGKKPSKPSEAKAAHKTVVKSAASKPAVNEKSKSAVKGTGSAKSAAVAKANVKPAKSAKTAVGKPAVKQTGKSGKPAPATVRRKAPDSAAKIKTAAKPGKNTTLAKR